MEGRPRRRQLRWGRAAAAAGVEGGGRASGGSSSGCGGSGPRRGLCEEGLQLAPLPDRARVDARGREGAPQLARRPTRWAAPSPATCCGRRSGVLVVVAATAARVVRAPALHGHTTQVRVAGSRQAPRW